MVRELVCGSCGRRYNSNYRGQHPKCKTCEFQHDHDHGLFVAPEFEEALVMLEKMDAAKKKEANLNKAMRKLERSIEKIEAEISGFESIMEEMEPAVDWDEVRLEQAARRAALRRGDDNSSKMSKRFVEFVKSELFVELGISQAVLFDKANFDLKRAVFSAVHKRYCKADTVSVLAADLRLIEDARLARCRLQLRPKAFQEWILGWEPKSESESALGEQQVVDEKSVEGAADFTGADNAQACLLVMLEEQRMVDEKSFASAAVSRFTMHGGHNVLVQAATMLHPTDDLLSAMTACRALRWILPKAVQKLKPFPDCSFFRRTDTSSLYHLPTAVLDRCEDNRKRLNIRDWHLLSDTTRRDERTRNSREANAAVSGLMHRFPFAKTVDFRWSDEESVSYVKIWPASLTAVNLSGTYGLHPAAVTALAAQCAALTSVNLQCCSKMTDDVVATLASNCKKLTNINLVGCRKLTDAAVASLASNCAGLANCQLQRVEQLTPGALAPLAENCKELVTIGINSDLSSDTVWPASLTSADLSGGDLSDDALAALAAQCPQLTSIKLTRCNMLTHCAVVSLAKHCARLTSVELNIPSGRLTNVDAAVVALAEHCPGLTSLDLSGLCSDCFAEPRRIGPTDVAAEALAKHCRGLTDIKVEDAYGHRSYVPWKYPKYHTLDQRLLNEDGTTLKDVEIWDGMAVVSQSPREIFERHGLIKNTQT